MTRAFVINLLVCLMPLLAYAKPLRAAEETPTQTLEQAREDGYLGRPETLKPGSLLGGSVAGFPGVVLLGLGHLYTEDYGVAAGLFVTELAGVAMMVTSQVLSKKYSQSEETAALEQAMSHFGFVLFMASWLADIIGTYKGNDPFASAVSRREGTRFGFQYRYTDNPINRFRHHLVIALTVDSGRLHLKPWLDLEAQLERREFGIEAGYLLLGDTWHQDHIGLGFRTARLENRPDGWASHTGLLFVDTRLDLGRWIDTLKRFFAFSRVGYGLSSYQFAPRPDTVPSLLQDGDLSDEWLYLESGASLSLASGTDVSLSLIQDPTGVISPVKLSSAVFETSANEVVKVELGYQYEANAGISVQSVFGDGFGIWLGLEYAL